MHSSNSNFYQAFPHNPLVPPPLPPPPPIWSSFLPPNGPPAPPGSSRTIIYIQNFASPGTKPTHETSWSTRIFGCCSDMNTCCATAACQCITAGQIAEIVDEGKTSCQEGFVLYVLFSLMCMHWVYTCHTRSKMRRRYLLKGSNCKDCLAHLCCMHCALCQEYRELDRHGLDPGIGWHENVERQKHAVAVFKITPPPVEEGMMR